MEYSDLVKIDLANIEVELVNQAKNFFLISKLLAEKTAKVEVLNTRIKTLKAKAAMEIKIKAIENGKKLTQNDVEYYLDTEPNLALLHNERIQLEMEKNILLGLVRSLEHKKDMLKSLSWSGSRDGT